MIKILIVPLLLIVPLFFFLTYKNKVLIANPTIVQSQNLSTPSTNIEPQFNAVMPSLDQIFSEDHILTATLPNDRKRVLIATGDIIPARVVNIQATKFNNFKWPYEETADILRAADIAFVNLETPLIKDCPLVNDGFKFCGSDKNIEGLLFSGVDVEDTELLEKDAAEMRRLISSAEMPEDLEKEIAESYETLNADKEDFTAKGRAMDILRTGREPPFVAVRSSATAEDLADASFAGQQESFLNVKGRANLIQKIKECFASLFTARAVYYRTKKGFSHETTYLAVVVQKMIDSEKSGVMFSKNPIKDDDTIMIEAVFGLGEGIVSGMIKPDSYLVSRDLDDFKILDTQISEKKVAIARTSSGKNEIVKLTKEKAMKQVLTTYEVKTLSQYAIKLEKHYKKPQDIEFAIEGGEVYIVQSRPITTLEKIQSYGKGGKASGNILLSGLGASPGIASGVKKNSARIEAYFPS